MSSPFSLSVPCDPRYRSLAGQAAGRYADALGGNPADVEGLVAAVSKAVDALAAESGADANVALAFRSEAGDVSVDVRCGARSSVVRYRLPTAQR